MELAKPLPEEEGSIQEITLDYQQARYAQKEPEKKAGISAPFEEVMTA